MIYGFLVVITFLLCLLFLYKFLRALIYVFSKKGKQFLQRFRKSKKSKSSTLKKKATSPRSERVTSQNNDESIRHRNLNEGRSPEGHRDGSGPAKASHRSHSTSKDNEKKDADDTRRNIIIHLSIPFWFMFK